MLLQIAGYLVQGLICLVYMPLCFQLARFTAEAASRVYCDLAQDIAAGQVPDIANANVPAVTRMFYSLPVIKQNMLCINFSMLTPHKAACPSLCPCRSPHLYFLGLFST